VRPWGGLSYTVVSRTLALLDTSPGVEEFYAASDVADADQQRDSIARVRRARRPVFERVAAAGEITAENRALAAQIRRLRTEL